MFASRLGSESGRAVLKGAQVCWTFSVVTEPDNDQVANDTEAHDSDGGLVVSH